MSSCRQFFLRGPQRIPYPYGTSLLSRYLLTRCASAVLPAALHLHRQGIGKQLLDLVKEVAELAG